MPTATISNDYYTATYISFDVNVVDEDNFVNLVGGWLRAVIYNEYNEIIAQQKLTNGNNTVTFDNLSADTSYDVMVFILGDIHDGNGVYVHLLDNQSYRTQSVIDATITSDILQNEQTGKYYPNISVEAQLNDDSFRFTKVEVCDLDGEVCYSGAFDGSIDITQGLLNNKYYVVKVYYESASGVEQSHISYVETDSLSSVWAYGPSLEYGLIDDGILGFDFSDYKSNFDNLTIKIVDEYSKQYIAEDAITLLDNPDIIAELNQQLDSLINGGSYTDEEYHA
ncbi:MAG: hypothetical protein ACI4GX_01555, partial [Ruminococcus sp.]